MSCFGFVTTLLSIYILDVLLIVSSEGNIQSDVSYINIRVTHVSILDSILFLRYFNDF